MRLVVRLIFDTLKVSEAAKVKGLSERAGDGSAEVGDGIGPVLEVEAVA